MDEGADYFKSQLALLESIVNELDMFANAYVKRHGINIGDSSEGGNWLMCMDSVQGMLSLDEDTALSKKIDEVCEKHGYGMNNDDGVENDSE